MKNAFLLPCLLALKLLFSASLSIGQIEPKPMTVALPDSIILEFEDDEHRKIYTPEVAAYAKKYLLEKGRNTFISYATENRIKVLKGNKAHLATYRLEFFIGNKMRLDPKGIEGWINMTAVGARLINKRSGEDVWQFPIHVIGATNTEEEFKQKLKFWTKIGVHSFEKEFFSMTSKYVPHKFVEAKKSFSIDSYFELEGDLPNPKDSVLIKSFTDIVNNALVHHIHDIDADEEHWFNYYDNYVRRDKEETDHTLHGKIRVKRDMVELELFWISQKDVPQYVSERAMRQFQFSLALLEKGDYSSLMMESQRMTVFLMYLEGLE